MHNTIENGKIPAVNGLIAICKYVCKENQKSITVTMNLYGGCLHDLE